MQSMQRPNEQQQRLSSWAINWLRDVVLYYQQNFSPYWRSQLLCNDLFCPRNSNNFLAKLAHEKVSKRPPNFKMVIECSNMLSPPFLRFRARSSKIAKVLFFENQFWAHRLTLSRYNLETETWEPKPYTCSESWVCKDSVGTSPKKFSFKISGMERFTKIFTFLQISVQQRGKRYRSPPSK